MAWNLTLRVFVFILNVSGLFWIAVVMTNDEKFLTNKKIINSSRHTSAFSDNRFKEMDHEKIKSRKIVVDTKYPVVLSRPYKINNEKICRDVSNLSVIVIVHTAPSHFKVRKLMRQTYLNSSHYGGKHIRVVFLLGLVSESSLQIKIEEENLTFNDIVQGYFIDSYHNLTNKGVMGFKWISEFCRNAEFVLKIDDDVFVNFFKVFEDISSIKKKSKYIMCNVMDDGMNPIQRGEKDRWYVHPDEFRHIYYYPAKSCSGFAVFLSTDLVPLLYQSAFMSPFFWVDDYYLFGILPSKIHGVVHYGINVNMSLYDKRGLPCYKDKGKQCPIFVTLHDGTDDFISRCWDFVSKNSIATTKVTNV